MAVAYVTHVCDGLDRESSSTDGTDNADANGTLELTMKLTTLGLFPVVWGHFDKCKEPAGDAGLTLDGSIEVLRRTRPELSWLFAFDGTLESQDDSLEGTYDFRITGAGIQVSVPLPEGNIVVGLDQDDIVVQDSEGTWVCDPHELTCTLEGKGTVITTAGRKKKAS
jgi:hypothetical protein